MASLHSQQRDAFPLSARGSQGRFGRPAFFQGTLAAGLIFVGLCAAGPVGSTVAAAADEPAAGAAASDRAPAPKPLTEAETAAARKDEEFRKAIDWTAWKNVPVLHKGRVKPIDSMAREYAEFICGRVNPTIEWNGVPRKFQAAELFYGWIVEPDRWDEVEFLRCDYEALRSQYLGLPLKSHDGVKLLVASPIDLQDPEKAKRFQDAVRAIEAKSKKDEGFEAVGVDKFVSDLARRAVAFRSIALDRSSIQRELGGLASQLPQVIDQVDASWNECLLAIEQLGVSEGPLSPERLRELRKQWTDRGLREAAVKLAAEGKPTPEAAYAAVKQAGEGLAAAREELVGLFTAATKAAAADEGVAARWKLAKESYNEHLKSVERVAGGVAMLKGMMFDNRKPLRVVPSLDPESLAEDRKEGQTQPWLDLETLLWAPLPYLTDKGYPEAPILEVRKRFEEAKSAYAKQDAPAFNAGLVALSASLRALGEKLTPMQQRIAADVRRQATKAAPGAAKDAADEAKAEAAALEEQKALLSAIAYPDPRRIETEVYYFKADPFLKAMIGYVLACICLSLAFGPLRTPMTFAGIAGLFTGLAFSLWGFWMRIVVSGYAPVTNMYETIVYVACVCAGLSLWFMLLPATWEGLKTGWRMTACPALPESEAPPAGASASGAALERSIAWGLQLPRLLLAGLALYMLAIVPYAAGGETILRLLPKVDLGSSLPNVNNLVVCVVGWCVLLTVMYYVPRMILALGAGLLAVPQSFAGDGWKTKLAKIVEHPRPLLGLGGATASALAAVIAWNSPTDMVDKNVQQLTPILRDNVWLTIHVMTIVASYAAGALSWGVGNVALLIYLFGDYRKVGEGHPVDPSDEHGSADGVDHRSERPAYLPPVVCATLAGYIYRVMQIAVVLLAAGTILGGLWADVSWGRFWGWDPKEVWALISLLAYLAVLHARYAGWADNFGLAAGAVLGFTAIMMSWYGVNFWLGAGLHAYAFGSGGQGFVFSAVLANWVLVAAAASRYRALTGRRGHDSSEPSEPASPSQPPREVATAGQ